jgi:hypothetical protein
MHWKFDIDQRALTRAFDDLTVKSAKLAFPDKYPVKIEFLRGATPFVFSGIVRATIKAINQQTSGALATSNITVANASIAQGILNTNTLQMLEFVKKFGERPVALELLVVDQAGAEVASWTVNCDLSRRYTDSGDVAQDIPSLKASQAEAVAGTDNTKWMTPLRTFQAIAAYLASSFQVTWAMISGKPSTFPPDSHTHTWSELLGKPAVFPPQAHAHTLPDIQQALEGAGIEFETTV